MLQHKKVWEPLL